MKPDKGNNKKNTFGLITLILWALVLTLLFRSCSASYASANEVQVDYSTFKQWVQEDKVERVLMQSGKYTITLRLRRTKQPAAPSPGCPRAIRRWSTSLRPLRYRTWRSTS